MLKAKPTKELVIKLSNEIGALYRVSKVVAEKGVNILATCNWVEGENAYIRLLTDDNLRAHDELNKQSYDVQEKPAIILEVAHKPGMLRHITGTLARERIDITHLYATAPLSADQCTVLLGTTDNDRAIVLLND